MKVENLTFFTEQEDLHSIVIEKLNCSSRDIKKIKTGWTNIVFDVKSANENYIIKFPRDDFWAKQIEKDAAASNFVRSSIGIRTANMEIYRHNGRPFSIHRKIKGSPLTERLSYIGEQNLGGVARSIAEIFYKIHSFNISQIPQNLNVKFYDFITNLPKADINNYDLSYFDEMLLDEPIEERVPIHGDLNIGNIILDENDNVEAVIDFAFFSISDIYSDIARFSCRIGDKFFSMVLDEYEKISSKKLDMDKIENRKRMWSYIEKEYMEYMRNVHPEIRF